METLTIASPESVEISGIMAALGMRDDWELMPSVSGCVVQRENNRVYIESEPDGTGGSLITLDYFDITLVKQVAVLVADSPKMFVDTDFGDRQDGASFVAKIKANPAWDWRSQS